MSKRKRLVLYQENNAPIQLIDEDDTDLEEYSKKLSEFMTLNNISILQTSSSALVSRPSKILSILVEEEVIVTPKHSKKKVTKKELKKVEKPKEVDIITDVD